MSVPSFLGFICGVMFLPGTLPTTQPTGEQLDANKFSHIEAKRNNVDPSAYDNNAPQHIVVNSSIGLNHGIDYLQLRHKRYAIKNTEQDILPQYRSIHDHRHSRGQRHARNRSKRKVPAVAVWALAGTATLLPCDMSVHNPKDSVQMVMWLREGTHTPLFSVDYREQAGGRPQVWRDNASSTARRAFLHLPQADLGVPASTTTNVNTLLSGGTFKQAHAFKHDYVWTSQDVLHDSNARQNSEPKSQSGGDEVHRGGLVLRDVELEDAAVYRCRLDFLLTPTRNNRVNLTVVVSPTSVNVVWKLGDVKGSASEGIVGPFREGDKPRLLCYTRDAWPAPRMVWFEDEVLLDDDNEINSGENRVDIDVANSNSVVVNVLQLPALTRSHHNRRYTCVAANSNLTRPAAHTIHLHMALDVVSVRMDEVDVVAAGESTEVQCTVWGSSPAPTVTWTLAGRPLPAQRLWVSEDGNVSVSVVMLTSNSSHDGLELRCIAYNPIMHPHHHTELDYRDQMTDYTILNVQYPPVVSVSLGRSLDAGRIKEGDDVYFECDAHAKPPPRKITWTHNGLPLSGGQGILVSNMTLVLQHVTRDAAGDYACEAHNAIGQATSEPLNLDIKYAPVCGDSTVSQHSVAKHENARISCAVLANPDDVSFTWAFNNTAEAVSVPSDRYVVEGTESVVNYTPVTELDYGTLLCWAENAIGKQDTPCVFQILAAGKPDPPHGCRAYDVTISSLQVTCLPGDDGGLGQTFLLQVLEAAGDGQPVVEVTREVPTFSVANLRPATEYRLLISAMNEKGESRPTMLQAYTVALNGPQHESSAEPTRERESSKEVAVGVIVGAVLACLPVAVLVIVVAVRGCLRVRARQQSDLVQGKEHNQADCDHLATCRPLLADHHGSGGGVSSMVGGASMGCVSEITTITGAGGVTTPSSMPPTPSPHARGDHHTPQIHPNPSYVHGAMYENPLSSDPRVGRSVECLNMQVAEEAVHSRYPRRTQKHLPLDAGGHNPTYMAVPRGPCSSEGEVFLDTPLPPPAAYGDPGYVASVSVPTTAAIPSAVPFRGRSFSKNYPVGPQPQKYMTLPGRGLAANCAGVNEHYQGYNGEGTGNHLVRANVDTKLYDSSSTVVSPPHSDTLRKEKNSYAQVGRSPTVAFNPLVSFTTSQEKCSVYPHERSGSLKRSHKPESQDIVRTVGNQRTRSGSDTSDNSGRESSV